MLKAALEGLRIIIPIFVIPILSVSGVRANLAGSAKNEMRHQKR